VEFISHKIQDLLPLAVNLYNLRNKIDNIKAMRNELGE